MIKSRTLRKSKQFLHRGRNEILLRVSLKQYR